MNSKIIGRVVGERIYDGTGITGTNTTETTFPDSNVSNALTGDKYINTDTGNMYRCVVGGDASIATWVWITCLKSNQWNLVNSLISDSTKDALTAAMGKRLKKLIDDVQVGTTELYCENEEVVTAIEMIIENVDTTLTFTDDVEETGTYEYTASGSLSEKKIEVLIADTGLGLYTTIKKVKSSDAKILELKMLNGLNVVYEAELGIWENLNDTEDNIKAGATITDGDMNLKTGVISKLINNVRTLVYPITHAMAVWYEFGETTVKDKFDNVDDQISSLAKIDYGTETITIESSEITEAEYASGTVPIVFTEPFTTTPKVVVTAVGTTGIEEAKQTLHVSSSGKEMALIGAEVFGDVSTIAGDIEVQFNWIAIGS